MKAEISLAIPPSSVRENMSQLRLSLQDVKESEDEEEEVVRRPTGMSNVILTPTHNPDGVNGGTAERSQASNPKSRSHSAKQPLQNGQPVTHPDSPVFTKRNFSPHRPVPPKSAPNLRPAGPRKGRTVVKSRDQNGAGDRAEFRASSQSPQGRSQSGRTDTAPGGRRVSNRPSRRRLISRSEDLSSSSGDPQSPRLSVSDQLQHSLNGTLSSEGSDDVRFLSVPASPGGRVVSATPKAWDVFEEHVRTIHDSSDMFSKYQGPSFRASSTFQETMVDLYGYPDYSNPPGPSLHNVATRGLMVAGAANRFLRLRKKPVGGGEDAKERVVNLETVETARRGWRVLKEHVHETYTKKRTSQAALSWSMLRHTLKGLSDREKTRMDLYRRYGIIPTVDQHGNLVTVNTMLSERARQAIASGSRHPLLAHSARAQPHDKPLPSPSTPAALSLSSLSSPRSSADSRGERRRARSSVIHSARSEARASVNGTGEATGVPARNRIIRRSAEFKARSPNRSHSP